MQVPDKWGGIKAPVDRLREVSPARSRCPPQAHPLPGHQGD